MTEPGAYAVDRAYNPDPSLCERERAAARADAGELPGGGRYAGERCLLGKVNNAGNERGYFPGSVRVPTLSCLQLRSTPARTTCRRRCRSGKKPAANTRPLAAPAA